jgi:hypothetical protein
MLRLSWATRILSLLLLGVPIGVVWWAVDATEPGPIFAAGAVAIACVVGVVAVLGWGWWVDHHGLRCRSLFAPRTVIGWSDVTSVHASAMECVVRSRHGAAPRFRASVVGYDSLAHFALLHIRTLGPPGNPTRQALERAARISGARGPVLLFPPDPPAPREAAVERWRDNPFYVLGLRPECSAIEVERSGQKVLGLLALEIASAKSYVTPVGPGVRTAEKVRSAMAELRDPDRRLLHEVWAALAPGAEAKAGADADAGARAGSPRPPTTRASAGDGWRDAMAALGYRTP